MNRRAPARSSREVHGQQEIPGQEITDWCTRVHAPEVHAPDPLFRGGGHPEDWEERLRAAVEKTLRAREARRAERAELARRRTYGKTIGNAERLRRARDGQPKGEPVTVSMTYEEQLAHVQKLAMSSALHLRGVPGPQERFQLVNIKGDRVYGGEFGCSLDEMHNLLAELHAHCADVAEAERKAWEAEHLGPNGDYFALDGDRVVKRSEYDPQKHGAIVRTSDGLAISQESLDKAKVIVDAKVEAGELVRLDGGRVIEASEYDPERHGPKDCGHTAICDHLS